MFPIKPKTACVLLFGMGVLGASVALVAQASVDKKESKTEDAKAQEAARQRSANNLKQLMLAMHNYHDMNEHFPPAAVLDKKGKALLSWRVLLLPYLDQEDLFAEFHLNEPWDSKHNKTLLAKMPKVYAPPVPDKTKEKDATFYQVFVGEGTIFEGKKGTSILTITDGTSNTIAIVEAGEAVPWTKPADLPYDAKKPLPKLGGLFDKGFYAALADGSVHWLKKNFDPATMHLAITRNDGNVLDFNKLQD